MTDAPATGSADVLVVGAGLAGLVAARRLIASGARVVLLDKSVGPGGRLATRRFAGASFDHGAQFFTVRSAEFAALVERLTQEGCPVDVWGYGFAKSRHIADGPAAAEAGDDGHPRYAVRGGMNKLAKHLATGLDIRAGEKVTRVRAGDGRWEVHTEAGGRWIAPRLLLTPPVPQSLALLGTGDLGTGDLGPGDGEPADGDAAPSRGTETGWDADVLARLRRITYAPCLTVLARLDGRPPLPAPGGVQFAEGPVGFLGENAGKGTSAEPALTVHLDGDVSDQRYDDPDDALVADVASWIAPWLGDVRISERQVKRWRYAKPTVLDDDRAVDATLADARVVFAGDAFGEPKVEGAARSGLEAARRLGG